MKMSANMLLGRKALQGCHLGSFVSADLADVTQNFSQFSPFLAIFLHDAYFDNEGSIFDRLVARWYSRNVPLPAAPSDKGFFFLVDVVIDLKHLWSPETIFKITNIFFDGSWPSNNPSPLLNSLQFL